MRGKFIKYLGAALLWGPVLLVAGLFLFSLYPNYILRGNHGPTFAWIRSLSDRIVFSLVGSEQDQVRSSDARLIEITENNPLPERTRHPLMLTKQTDEVPASLYFERPARPVVVHAAMVPEPFVTYAPAAGDINGIVRHNGQQFRYPVDLKSKQQGEVRIFVTGGSTAWGAFASGMERTIAGYLEEELRKRYGGRDIKVITAAAGGWTSTQERIWIFNRITEYGPDMVIAYSGHNDLFQVHLRKTDLFNQYDTDGEYYLYAIEEYERYNRGPAVFDLIMTRAGENARPTDYPGKTLKNIRIVGTYLKTLGIPFVYVLQPVRKRERDEVQGKYEMMARETRELARRTGIGFIDHSALFDTVPALFYDRCHFGDRGYRHIADDLLARIDWDAVVRKAGGRQHGEVTAP